MLLRPSEDSLFRPVTAEDWTNAVPRFTEESSQLTSLQKRLIDANLRRRFWFLYAQHPEKLAGPQISTKPQTSIWVAASLTTSPTEGSKSREQSPSGLKLNSSKAAIKTDKNAAFANFSKLERTVETTSPNVIMPGVSRTRITASTAVTQYDAVATDAAAVDQGNVAVVKRACGVCEHVAQVGFLSADESGLSFE